MKCAIFSTLPFGLESSVEHIDHILVVDDDRDIRELIVDYLIKSGYGAPPAGGPPTSGGRGGCPH